ncbi:hypothetical protein [Spirosoma validum]|uniref:Uncharacterized protein n=1 Tax=Spirosoma validum TaxID=2771355 RepID=A0A927GCU6_9BACT|nr:hypothetical protein [Spirosoma validum]MBD2753112.1 hypothetical protein [Spirosoma validum]
MAKDIDLAAENTRLKLLVKQKDKAISKLEQNLQDSQQKNKVLALELKKK